MGLLEVTRKAYPDSTSADSQWLTCDFPPVRTLPNPVTLAAVKANPHLTDFFLLKQPRLAVMPLTEFQFKEISLGSG